MILNDSSISSNPDLDLLAAHITSEIKSAGMENPQSPAMSDGNELARSVAEFVFRSEASERDESERAEQSRRSPSQSAMAERVASGGILIPSDYLLIMTCRALWAVGREQDARALLRTKGPELNVPESYADALFGKGLFPCLGMHSALVRAFRPSSFPWSMSGPCWILNLRTVFSFPGAGLELTILRIMHAMARQLAVLWDASGGKGTFALNNSCYLCANVLGFPAKSRQGRRFTAELIRYCEQDLQMAADERNWRATPMVMDIDG